MQINEQWPENPDDLGLTVYDRRTDLCIVIPKLIAAYLFGNSKTALDIMNCLEEQIEDEWDDFQRFAREVEDRGIDQLRIEYMQEIDEEDDQ